jgi:hypothetical protein
MGELSSFMADPAVETQPASEPTVLEQIRDQVRVLVARLVDGSLSLGGLAPAGVGIRGEDQASCHYQADGVEVVIGVRPDAHQPDRSAILGLVIGLQEAKLVAQLWQGHRRIATATVDELDSFVIPSIAPGRYDLVLSGPKIEILIQDLQIGTPGGEPKQEDGTP